MGRSDKDTTRADILTAYEALVARGADGGVGAAAAARRPEFERRTGAYRPEDPWFEARSQAFWDDTVTNHAFLTAAGPLAGLGPAVTERLARAHRGLFVVDRPPTDDLVLLRDLWSGAELLVRVTDEAQGVVLAHAEGPFDGRVVGTADGSLTLLAGAFHHPAESLAVLDGVLDAARKQELGTTGTLDALLRMELVFRASSRVKVTFAYRTDGLNRA